MSPIYLVISVFISPSLHFLSSILAQHSPTHSHVKLITVYRDQHSLSLSSSPLSLSLHTITVYRDQQDADISLFLLFSLPLPLSRLFSRFALGNGGKGGRGEQGGRERKTGREREGETRSEERVVGGEENSQHVGRLEV